MKISEPISKTLPDYPRQKNGVQLTKKITSHASFPLFSKLPQELRLQILEEGIRQAIEDEDYIGAIKILLTSKNVSPSLIQNVKVKIPYIIQQLYDNITKKRLGFFSGAIPAGDLNLDSCFTQKQKTEIIAKYREIRNKLIYIIKFIIAFNISLDDTYPSNLTIDNIFTGITEQLNDKVVTNTGNTIISVEHIAHINLMEKNLFLSLLREIVNDCFKDAGTLPKLTSDLGI